MSCSFDEKSLTGVLTSSIEEYVPTADPVTLVQQALANPVNSLEEAMELAKQLLGNNNPTVNAIPDGIAVMVKA